MCSHSKLIKKANPLVQSFTTGNSSTAYQVTNLSLIATGANNSATDNFSVAIYTDVLGLPGTSLLSFTGPNPVAVGQTQFNYLPAGSVPLNASTTYWLVATSSHPSQFISGNFYYWVSPNNSNYAALEGWTIPGSGFAASSANGSSWSLISTEDQPNPFQFGLDANAVPEPAILGLLCGALGVLVLRRWLRAGASEKSTPV